MRYRIEIADGQDEDIVVYAKENSAVLERIEALLAEGTKALLGFRGDEVVQLTLEDVLCFLSESGKVYAITEHERYVVKQRLYRLEEMLSSDFVKINQSCLVRVSKIKRFDSSIGGALLVVMQNGYKDYVSRRQLKTVKERLGF